MEVQENFKSRYRIQFGETAIPSGFVAEKIYFIEFQPYDIKVSLSAGIPAIVPFPRAIVVSVHGQLTLYWEVPPADSEITATEFEIAAKERVVAALSTLEAPTDILIAPTETTPGQDRAGRIIPPKKQV